MTGAKRVITLLASPSPNAHCESPSDNDVAAGFYSFSLSIAFSVLFITCDWFRVRTDKKRREKKKEHQTILESPILCGSGFNFFCPGVHVSCLCRSLFPPHVKRVVRWRGVLMMGMTVFDEVIRIGKSRRNREDGNMLWFFLIWLRSECWTCGREIHKRRFRFLVNSKIMCFNCLLIGNSFNNW